MVNISSLILRSFNRIASGLIRAGELPAMRSARTALIFTTPILVAGSFAILIKYVPLAGYQDFMAWVFGPGWAVFPDTIWNATFGLISIVLVFIVSQQIVNNHNLKFPLRAVNPVIPALTAQVSLFCLIFKPTTADADRWALTGVGGLFVAIFLAMITTKIFLWLAGKPFLRLKVGAAGPDMITGQVLDLLIPGLMIIAGVVLLDQALFTNDRTVYDLISNLIKIPFKTMDSELGQGILYIIICQIAWFFGLHGANLMDSVTHAIFANATLENLLAVNSGLPPPHIITKQFFDVFVNLGGSGGTIGLVLAIFIAGKSRGARRIAQLSVLPTVFNVNELILFGTPVVLNPIYLIPFMATPILMALIAYLAIYAGLLPNSVADPAAAPWTLPAFFSGYLVVKSWHGPVLQLLNITVSVICYLPFVIMADRAALTRFKNTMAEITNMSVKNDFRAGKKYLHRTDDIGAVTRILAMELEQALKNNQEIYLEYQPQVHAATNRVQGVEVLVRWRHPVYGLIAPSVIVGLAEDGNFIDRLGLKVLNEACAQQKAWIDQGVEGVTMSINVSVRQLHNPAFETAVLEIIKSRGLPTSVIKLEVTESVALAPDAPSNRILTALHEKGVQLAIDDFGMGHSSLAYFTQFPINTLKIDGALSKDVLSSATSANIISTIVKFCENMNVEVIVECVDRQKQLEALYALGCRIFQGYLFSRPLAADDCLEYIRRQDSRPLLLPVVL